MYKFIRICENILGVRPPSPVHSCGNCTCANALQTALSYTVLVPGARETYHLWTVIHGPIGRRLALIRGCYIYVQSRYLAAAPQDFFVFMEEPGAPSPATLSRPMPAKLRPESAAPTPRSRGGPAPVACSPGAYGPRQLSRYPKKPTKRCVSVHMFFLAENIEGVYHLIRLLYCSLYYRPTRHTKRESRAHFSV